MAHAHLRHDDPGFAAALRSLNRRATPAPHVAEAVAAIIAEVRATGDAALWALGARFGGPAHTPGASLRVTPTNSPPPPAPSTPAPSTPWPRRTKTSAPFALKGLRHDWHLHNRQGVQVGERFDPFPRVGVYVPGGTAPLVSTALMTVTLAAAARVPEIVVTTPADAHGHVAPALLCALELAGATEVYKVGGAQAIAALAYGTESIAPVVKIFGPGNAYVIEAKRQVFGPVSIDQLPGPSEILVLADRTGRPEWIAADLLAQAEHGANSVIGLVTDHAPLLDAVRAALDAQLAQLHRQAQLGPVLEKDTFFCLVENLDAAIALANDFAPEHLSVCTADPDAVAARVHTAGAIFLGGWSPVAGGDFLAGPSHTLPTGGAGKGFAGLTVDQFQRRTSLIRFDENSLRQSVSTIQAFSALEGLDAHGRSATIRFD